MNAHLAGCVQAKSRATRKLGTLTNQGFSSLPIKRIARLAEGG